jgi:hypothetical protein
MEPAQDYVLCGVLLLRATSVLSALLREYVLPDSKLRVKQTHARLEKRKSGPCYFDRLVQDDPCV